MSNNEHIVAQQHEAREKTSVISGFVKQATKKATAANNIIIDNDEGEENNAATTQRLSANAISANISPKTILMRLGAFGIFAIIVTFTVLLKDRIAFCKALYNLFNYTTSTTTTTN